MKLVNLGCGSRFHPDFVNIDMTSTGPGVMAYDLSRGIPLRDGEADVVYSAATLEHLRPADARRFMQECFRVLKPGGVIRIGVPDTERLCRLYLKKLEQAMQGDAEAAHDYEWLRLEMFDQAAREMPGGEMLDYLSQSPLPGKSFVLERIGEEGRSLLEPAGLVKRTLTAPRIVRFAARTLRNQLLRIVLGRKGYWAYRIGMFRLSGEAHQQMYDRFSLGRLLLSVGFRDQAIVSAAESRIEGWSAFHLDVTQNGSVIKPDLIFIEACKPPAF